MTTNTIKWNIYYESREYSRVMGDPILGSFEAETKEEAERKASLEGMGGVAGVWAVATPYRTANR